LFHAEKKRCAIHHKRCSEKLINSILKMVFTVAGGVRPKNRFFEINQALLLLFYPKHIKKAPMPDKTNYLSLIFLQYIQYCPCIFPKTPILNT